MILSQHGFGDFLQFFQEFRFRMIEHCLTAHAQRDCVAVPLQCYSLKLRFSQDGTNILLVSLELSNIDQVFTVQPCASRVPGRSAAPVPLGKGTLSEAADSSWNFTFPCGLSGIRMLFNWRQPTKCGESPP